MTWIRRTLDELFSERSQLTSNRVGPSEEARRQRDLEIEIEARRGVRGF